MSATITKRNEDGRPEEYRCDCGAKLYWEGPGRDLETCRCGRDHNSAGQELAPRAQWGEETGETAADYDRGVNDPGHAFDGDY
jgi:hypothetical protein